MNHVTAYAHWCQTHLKHKRTHVYIYKFPKRGGSIFKIALLYRHELQLIFLALLPQSMAMLPAQTHSVLHATVI